MKRLILLAVLPALVLAAPAHASFTQEPGSPFKVDTDPFDVIAADFNGDKRPDLAVANGTASTISVLLRQAGGGFVPEGPAIPSGGGTNGVAAADFNSDGRLDLASSNYTSGDVRVFLRNPTGGFTWEGNVGYAAGNPGAVAGADVTGDGLPDLIGGGYDSDATYVFKRNNGPGFAPEGGLYQGTGHRTDLLVADFNGDGRLDIASANDTATTVAVMLRNAANTGFSFAPDMAIGARALKLAAADFNRDGRLDLAVTSYHGDFVAVRLGKGDGTFTPAPNVSVGDGPYGIAAADFNSDGVADLAVANQNSRSVSVLLRSGAGWVADPTSPVPTGQDGANGLAAADFNGDGKADIAVTNQTSTSVTILLNTTAGPVAPPPPNLDADGDGVQTPTDCNDANPAIRPGAVDVPGDGIDQDCSGADAKLPVIARTIAGFWATFAGPYTKFTALTVKPARKGDRVKLTCKGPGCRAKGRTVKVKKDKRSISMLKHLKGSRLRKGAVVRLRVTRPGTIGRVNTWTIRAPKAPKLVRRCVVPGKKKPQRCPAS